MKALLPTTIKGIATALEAEHPKLRERIAKAIDLIYSDRFAFYAHSDEGEAIYTARSSENPRTHYTVMAGSCTCPARKLCYHRVARGILVTRSANRTAVAFDEALSLEEQEPTDTGAGTTLTAPTTETKPVLKIRESMDALGKHLKKCRQLLTMRPA